MHNNSKKLFLIFDFFNRILLLTFSFLKLIKIIDFNKYLMSKLFLSSY